MLIWVDTETTGLDPRRERLLEVAVIVTDDKLLEVERLHLVTDEARHTDWSKVDPYVLEMHCKNGLWGESLARGESVDSCSRKLEALIARHTEIVPAVDATADKPAQPSRVITPQLAGSTVSFDREMLRVHMPAAERMLHYRSLDVTAFNELARRVWPEIHKARPRQPEGTPAAAAHRAMADIEASLRTAVYYSTVLAPGMPREPSLADAFRGPE